jgi:hypothetical protein
VLPAGYKGTFGMGRQLGFLVKGFNQKVENNDWVTTIEAYPFLIPDSETTDKLPLFNTFNISVSKSTIEIVSGKKVVLGSVSSNNSLTLSLATLPTKTLFPYFAPFGIILL